MTALKLWALVVLLHLSSASLYLDNILRLSNELDDLKKDVTLMAEKMELKNKVEKLSANRSAVAFTVSFSFDDGINGISLGTGQILRFDHMITNIGGGYDKTTGIFSAPFAGVYGFFLKAMSINTRGPLYLAIDKHGTVLDIVFANGIRDHDDQSSTQVTTHLATGEQVWVRQYYGNAVRGGTWTIFTGYLITMD